MAVSKASCGEYLFFVSGDLVSWRISVSSTVAEIAMTQSQWRPRFLKVDADNGFKASTCFMGIPLETLVKAKR